MLNIKKKIKKKSENSLLHTHNQKNDTKLTLTLVFLILLFSNLVSLVFFSLCSTLYSSITDFLSGKSKISLF